MTVNPFLRQQVVKKSYAEKKRDGGGILQVAVAAPPDAPGDLGTGDSALPCLWEPTCSWGRADWAHRRGRARERRRPRVPKWFASFPPREAVDRFDRCRTWTEAEREGTHQS